MSNKALDALKFWITRDEFKSVSDYQSYWLDLYKYEIYSRLFSDKDLGDEGAVFNEIG